MKDKAVVIAYRWWQAMFLSERELKNLGIKPAPSVQKAQLKRCINIDAAMLSAGFRDLWLSLPEDVTNESKPQDLEQWAAIAMVLVYVKQDSDVGLATVAGQKIDGEKSLVSELRFSQLQSATKSDEFVRRLRRIISQVNGATSVKQLIQDIQQWFIEHYSYRPQTSTNRLAIRWAMQYYQAAK